MSFDKSTGFDACTKKNLVTQCVLLSFFFLKITGFYKRPKLFKVCVYGCNFNLWTLLLNIHYFIPSKFCSVSIIGWSLIYWILKYLFIYNLHLCMHVMCIPVWFRYVNVTVYNFHINFKMQIIICCCHFNSCLS